MVSQKLDKSIHLVSQNNLNYAICIKKESGFCSITYSTDGFGLKAMANEFNIVNFRDDDSGKAKYIKVSTQL